MLASWCVSAPVASKCFESSSGRDVAAAMTCHRLYSYKHLVTLKDEDSLLKDYLTINAGELQLELLMAR